MTVRHVTITADPGDEIRLHLVAADDDTDSTATVAGMLAYLTAHGPHAPEMYNQLTAAGYVPDVPRIRKRGKPRENYLGWNDPARPLRQGRFALYQRARTLSIERAEDQDTAAALPGAVHNRKHVAFRTHTSSEAAQAMAAAKAIKR